MMHRPGSSSTIDPPLTPANAVVLGPSGVTAGLDTAPTDITTAAVGGPKGNMSSANVQPTALNSPTSEHDVKASKNVKEKGTDTTAIQVKDLLTTAPSSPVRSSKPGQHLTRSTIKLHGKRKTPLQHDDDEKKMEKSPSKKAQTSPNSDQS